MILRRKLNIDPHDNMQLYYKNRTNPQCRSDAPGIRRGPASSNNELKLNVEFPVEKNNQ